MFDFQTTDIVLPDSFNMVVFKSRVNRLLLDERASSSSILPLTIKMAVKREHTKHKNIGL